MKIEYMEYRYLTVTAKCPECGEETGTDMGGGPVKNLKRAGFFCKEHGEFFIDADWGHIINEYRKSE